MASRTNEASERKREGCSPSSMSSNTLSEKFIVNRLKVRFIYISEF